MLVDYRTCISVREEDANLPSPFTQPLTASMVRMKDEQAKEKAHPKGTSKILAKARKKAMEDEASKKGQGHTNAQVSCCYINSKTQKDASELNSFHKRNFAAFFTSI